MKLLSNHLPESKQAELRQIVAVIINLCDDIEMIILFGSYARGDWKEAADLDPNRKSGNPSDYDILAVSRQKETVRNSLLWEKISMHCNVLDLSASVRIIVHDIKFIQQRLREIHYFFSDIVKEGRLLYDTGNYQLGIKHELKPHEMHRISTGHFNHWHKRAEEFYYFFESALAKNWDKMAAFHLHQAHEIRPSLAVVFPRDKQTDAKRFKLFDYAYIGARYDPDFHMTTDDLRYLSERVEHLIGLSKKLCKEKIESFINIRKNNG